MIKPKFDSSFSGTGFPFSIAGWSPLGAVPGPLGDWLRCAGRVQNEVLNFAQERFRRDVDAMECFARCRKPEEYVDAQAKFLAETYSDYAKENLKITGMLGEAAQWTRENFAGTGAGPT